MFVITMPFQLREDIEASLVKLLRAGVHGFYLEELDKVELAEDETVLQTIRHLREAADHYDNKVAHNEDGHYPRDRALMVPEAFVKVMFPCFFSIKLHPDSPFSIRSFCVQIVHTYLHTFLKIIFVLESFQNLKK